jgi:lipopolysaccharide exporter
MGDGLAVLHAGAGAVRLLVPADFGLIALAAGFMQTIDGVMTLGVEVAVIRERAPSRDVYDTAFTINRLRGLLVGGLVAAAFPTAGFFDEPRLAPVLLVVACLPVLDGAANIGAVDFRRDFAVHKEFAIMVLPKLGGILAVMASI